MEMNVANFHEKMRESPGLALTTRAAAVGGFGPQVTESRVAGTFVRDGSDDLSNDTGIICSKKDVAGVNLTIDSHPIEESMLGNESFCGTSTPWYATVRRLPSLTGEENKADHPERE